MSAALPPAPAHTLGARPARPASDDGRVARLVVIALSLGFVGCVLVLPVVAVLVEALGAGLGPLWTAIRDPNALAALRLTLVATAVSVPLNAVCGVAAAYCIARYRFPGRAILVSLTDVPMAVSPVVAGMMLFLLFGHRSVLGEALVDRGLQVLFAPPAVVLATVFVTFPYVARELLPLLEAEGVEEEQAALVLGAGGLTTFLRITLPKARWALLHGVVLSTARALGEFGAVSVVSGHVRGHTVTLPLAIEMLHDEYRFREAFALATVLLLLAALSLIAKRAVERRAAAERAEHRGEAPA